MIVGGGGLLGQKMLEVMRSETDWQLIIAAKNHLVDEEGYQQWDSLSRSDWKSIIMTERWKPDVIVNCAALTNVDACEINRKEAWQTNVHLVELIAEMCRKVDAKLVQISTDYVFEGTSGPYWENDRPNPINYYGKTKLAAENVCVSHGIQYAILRTMWLYGTAEGGRKTFVDWLVESLSAGNQVNIVNDEFGSPTLTDDVAFGTVKVIEKSFEGIINLAGSETVSRWEWAQTICKVYGINNTGSMKSIPSEQLERKAPRPLRSGLVPMKAQTVLGVKTLGVETGVSTYRTQLERKLIDS